MRFIRLYVIKNVLERQEERGGGVVGCIFGCKHNVEKGPLANLCPIKMQIQDSNKGHIQWVERLQRAWSIKKKN